jgi:hypothetical protein
LPRADDKSMLLAAVNKVAELTGLTVALHAIGLSVARFSAWIRNARGCDLDDHDSCPKTSPHKRAMCGLLALRQRKTSPCETPTPSCTR